MIALPPIGAATEDMDFVWYFSDVVLSAGFAYARTLPTRPERGGSRRHALLRAPDAPPTPDLRPAAGWVIRRPLSRAWRS